MIEDCIYPAGEPYLAGTIALSTWPGSPAVVHVGGKYSYAMLLTDKQTDLLIGGIIGGIIGVVGTLVSSFCKAIGSRYWAWWDNRQAMKAEIRRYRTLIGNTDSPGALSGLLVSLKDFALSNEQVLERPKVKQFFDVWLKDFLLDAQGEHSKLSVLNCLEAISQLKADAASLIQW